jgi:hypothetical protein
VSAGFRSFQNNQAAGGYSNIFVEATDDITLDDTLLGEATETAAYALRVEDTVTGLRARGNHVKAIKASGGNGYSIGSSTAYTVLREWRGNTAASTVATPWDTGVLNIVTRETDELGRKRCYAAKAVLTSGKTPPSGTWVEGSVIDYSDPDPSGYRGSVCTTGGAPGTWNRFGTAEA